jgi:hypothetical protein
MQNVPSVEVFVCKSFLENILCRETHPRIEITRLSEHSRVKHLSLKFDGKYLCRIYMISLSNPSLQISSTDYDLLQYERSGL